MSEPREIIDRALWDCQGREDRRAETILLYLTAEGYAIVKARDYMRAEAPIAYRPDYEEMPVNPGSYVKECPPGVPHYWVPRYGSEGYEGDFCVRCGKDRALDRTLPPGTVERHSLGE